ncbi:UNVERIFIED_CONTAM: putative phosphoesterase [Brevibacillus sp. OAP136]
MKIAALYDIHGNLPALNALLDELEDVRPDLIVIGGDIIYGPMPSQTLERLFQLESQVQFIRGNCDREVVMAFDGVPLRPDMSDKVRDRTEWVASQLTRTQRDFLSQLPLQFTQSIEGLGDVLFCHAAPYSDEAIFTPNTDTAQLLPLFEGVQQSIVVCGHTHIMFERSIGNIRIINAGSVGMAYADQPGAYWLLLSPDGWEFRRTAYDVEAAAEEILRTTDPQAKEFAEENVVRVPTVAEMIVVIDRMVENIV